MRRTQSVNESEIEANEMEIWLREGIQVGCCWLKWKETKPLTCFKSNVIVTNSYWLPDASVGLCHHFAEPSITFSMGCRRSGLFASQMPHLVLRCRRSGCASIVWQNSSRVGWPHVAFAYKTAFGAILNIGGHNPPTASSVRVSGEYSISATNAEKQNENWN